jgi:hypothetical protein
VAADGLGALVVGKVLVKIGFLVGALIFLETFRILMVAGLAGLVARPWRGRKKWV